MLVTPIGGFIFKCDPLSTPCDIRRKSRPSVLKGSVRHPRQTHVGLRVQTRLVGVESGSRGMLSDDPEHGRRRGGSVGCPLHFKAAQLNSMWLKHLKDLGAFIAVRNYNSVITSTGLSRPMPQGRRSNALKLCKKNKAGSRGATSLHETKRGFSSLFYFILSCTSSLCSITRAVFYLHHPALEVKCA